MVFHTGVNASQGQVFIVVVNFNLKVFLAGLSSCFSLLQPGQKQELNTIH